RRFERVFLLTHRDSLRVGTRLGAVSRSSVAVNRRAPAALPRAAGPLLLEGLLAGARDFGAGLRLVRPPPLAREIRPHPLPPPLAREMRLDHLPDEVAAERVLEDFLRKPDLADALLLPVQNRQCGHGRSSSPTYRPASRMRSARS